MIENPHRVVLSKLGAKDQECYSITDALARLPRGAVVDDFTVPCREDHFGDTIEWSSARWRRAGTRPFPNFDGKILLYRTLGKSR